MTRSSSVLERTVCCWSALGGTWKTFVGNYERGHQLQYLLTMGPQYHAPFGLNKVKATRKCIISPSQRDLVRKVWTTTILSDRTSTIWRAQTYPRWQLPKLVLSLQCWCLTMCHWNQCGVHTVPQPQLPDASVAKTTDSLKRAWEEKRTHHSMWGETSHHFRSDKNSLLRRIQWRSCFGMDKKSIIHKGRFCPLEQLC